MYLQKWSLIWLTAVEISQQSHNSPVIESRAVKYYSNKSSKSPLKNCPCSGISHSHKGGGSWEKGSKRRGKIFPQREPQAEDPAHPIWWPNCGREIKKQRLWAIKKCCWKFNHGYSKGLSLLLATCWNRLLFCYRCYESCLCRGWEMALGGEEPQEQRGEGQIWNDL